MPPASNPRQSQSREPAEPLGDGAMSDLRLSSQPRKRNGEASETCLALFRVASSDIGRRGAGQFNAGTDHPADRRILSLCPARKKTKKTNLVPVRPRRVAHGNRSLCDSLSEVAVSG